MIGISLVLARRKFLGDAPSIQFGQHDVEQNEIRPFGTGQGKRRDAIGGLERVEPGAAQVEPADQADRGLVVDDQNPPHLRTACARVPRRVESLAELA